MSLDVTCQNSSKLYCRSCKTSHLLKRHAQIVMLHIKADYASTEEKTTRAEADPSVPVSPITRGGGEKKEKSGEETGPWPRLRCGNAF